jgi:starch-binding outer membrane protein, SusD/RagB family
MKKIIYSLTLLLSMILTTSCNDWLDILPNNEQVTDDYWKSKEDVEAVLASGYYYMRECVPYFIKWGELRGGTLYSNNTADVQVQNFNETQSYDLCNYATVYKAISMANSVIKYAPNVRSIDNTYYESVMNSHLCEAYFIRAYCYFTLVKNYRDVPLVLDAYVDDGASFNTAKSSDSTIIAQIKKDVKTALATGAAKGTYEENWETKGRVTKWALYALMADVCLWNEDYDECIEYANMILNATDSFRPAFMTNTSDWYTMFYPGNSNESIFELNWNKATYGETNNFNSLFSLTSSSRLKLTTRAVEKMKEETNELKSKGYATDTRMGRMLLSTYVPSSTEIMSWPTTDQYYVWKYYGTDVADIAGGARTSANQDANFILYRVSEVMLMKAEALVMKGSASFLPAVELINKIRNRAGLDNYKGIDTSADDAEQQMDQLDELTLLEEILNQRDMEFVAEGKRWYDLLRFGRKQNFKYKKEFIAYVLEGNQTTNSAWVQSVLQNTNAWYMPLPESDINSNPLLVQNPYYATTK